MLPDVEEVELIDAPVLNDREASFLDQHSFLNVLNVLTGELEVLGLTLAGKADALEKSLAVCRHFTRELDDSEAALRNASCTAAYNSIIDGEISSLLARHPDAAQAAMVQESCEAISAILDVFAVRSREILDRANRTDYWKMYRPEELHENFIQVLTAIQLSAKGRFGFAFEPSVQEPNDYLIKLRFDSGGAQSICMPPVFVDVIRDLLANARKYTEPGGRIEALLVQSASELSFSISDTGCGIPRDELTKVAEFGYRAQNVRDRPTRGGGFGLTKALHTVKRYQGRMWIASELGKGTRIRFVLPK